MAKRRRNKPDSYTWAKQRIASLYDDVKQLNDVSVTTPNHGIWSIKKLIALDCYIEPFYQIMKKRFKKVYYVDPFAGSGLIRLNGNIFPGSPIVALLSSQAYPFDKYYLSDINTNFVSVLKKRIDLIKKGNVSVETKITPFQEVSDKLFTGAKPDNWFDTGYLLFLDPYGMQVNWINMERILTSGAVDMIFTFMTWAIVWNRNNDLSQKKLDQYFGDSKWRELNTQDEFVSYYCRKIEGLGYKTIILDVISHRQKRYDLILASQSDVAAFVRIM